MLAVLLVSISPSFGWHLFSKAIRLLIPQIFALCPLAVSYTHLGVMIDDVDILLFDEPLANLDPATGKRAIALIDSIQKEQNKTILIIEHRLEDALYKDCLLYTSRCV